MEATMVGASSFCVANGGAGHGLGSHQTSFMVGSRGGGAVALKACCRAEELSGSGRKAASVSVQAKGRRNAGIPGRQTNRQQMPAMPPMDNDDNPKFVLFIRTLNVPRWYPLSVVTGGTTAKMMVGAMKNDWGKKLYEGTLTRNIAGVIYKDERALRQTAFKQYPVLKAASGFQYGYKIMDAKNPKSALFGTDVVTIPPQEELNSVVDKVKGFFGKIGESFGSVGNLPSGEAGGSKGKK